MLLTIEGVYRNGHVELTDPPEEPKEARVIVTFLPGEAAPQRLRPPLSAADTADLRWRLASWEEDWNAPGMEAYDPL